MTSLIEKAWYHDNWLARVLVPFAWLFFLVSKCRRSIAQRKSSVVRLAAPVIVVGNISVGGTGKTPLLITMVKELRARGYRPGVISRGYGGNAVSYPLSITATTSASEGGDEPVLIAQQVSCPVVVDPNRLQAAQYLLENFECDVVLSDDGMQHYRLPRDIEIAVIDGGRGFGNGRLLPAGPLREPESRLQETDFVIVNGGEPRSDHANSFSMLIEPETMLRPLAQGKPLAVRDWPYTRRTIHAVAGIGNPQRFANTLKQLRFKVDLHPFPDHHNFSADELQFDDDKAVFMTAKDAVKCAGMNLQDCWVVDVSAHLPVKFWDKLQASINQIEQINMKTGILHP
jgi:tetraacyldisaccharide 4'-kinase